MKLLILISICLIALFAFAIPDFSQEKNNYEQEKFLTVMRKIGHELLLSGGDGHSKILPIEKAGENSYHIKFETPFRFETPELVDIVRKNMLASNLPSQYIVSVRDCHNKSILYSYEFTPATNVDSLACLNRENDFGCYSIMISFADADHAGFFRTKFIAFSIPVMLLSILSFIFFSKKGKKEKTSISKDQDIIKIGGIDFNHGNRELIYSGHQRELTEKEARILKIFASRQNETIERDQLLKEVWEDEGVFVGRSLDVFVSRLRKKLEIDPSVKLINVHGRGYKLETDLSR